jgi:hypothetical protein
LLQHHFGYPYAIRIAAAAPRQIALVRAKPVEHARLKSFQIAAY